MLVEIILVVTAGACLRVMDRTIWRVARNTGMVVMVAVGTIRVLEFLVSRLWYCAWVLTQALLATAILTWLYGTWQHKQHNPHLPWITAGSGAFTELQKLLKSSGQLLTRIWHLSAPLLVPVSVAVPYVVELVTGAVGLTSQVIDTATGLSQNQLQVLKRIMQREIDVLRGEPRYSDLHYVSVRRHSCLADSMRALPPSSSDLATWRKPLHIEFMDEAGVDAGGLKRVWISVVGRQLQAAVLSRTGNDTMHEYFVAPACSTGSNLPYKQLLESYQWFGMLLGKILVENNRAWPEPLQLSLPFELAPIFYRLLLGGTPSYSDIERVDPVAYRTIFSRLARADPGTLEALCLTFVYYRRSRGGTQRVQPLKAGGANIPVTYANKEEFMRLYRQEIERGVMEQMDRVVEGFLSVVPQPVYQHLQRYFTPEQLKLLFEGSHRIDLEALQQAVGLEGYGPGDPEILWFWETLHHFSGEQRSAVLEFVTGCNGMPALDQGDVAFTIRRSGARGGTGRARALPVAHTCSKILDLQPGYRSQQEMQQALEVAIANMGSLCLA